MDIVECVTQGYQRWGVPARPTAGHVDPALTVDSHGWRVTGRTFDNANPGVVTTDGRGYWRIWLGEADGGRVYRQLDGPGYGTYPGHFLYWNGSVYIQYIHLEPTPANIERMRSGDLIWLTQKQLLVERDQVKDLLFTTRTVVLMRPRTYREIGAPGGNHKGPWYRSGPMWCWLILAATWWGCWSVAIYVGIQGTGNDQGSVAGNVIEGMLISFFMTGVWFILLCALAAAMFRVDSRKAKWLTMYLGALVGKRVATNRINKRTPYSVDDLGGAP